MIKKINARDELNKKLNSNERKLLSKVLREKGINVREKLEEGHSAYKKELKKTLLTTMVAAFGFLLAISWREVLGEYIAVVTSLSPVQGSLIEAGFITIIVVFGILIFTKILSE
ncbi:hypothetical protein HON86_00385 [Candidatus Woesearchaeota archaeon]|jgi:polyferredoxin|nr:hypothetical protein [archaeon]MBT4835064.1 hypothetical protein [Candidatus Woesearchaeota archaeon]MBT7474909.1 hypothetical protein [Candidatus Woesearchaeota archaeon]